LCKLARILLYHRTENTYSNPFEVLAGEQSMNIHLYTSESADEASRLIRCINTARNCQDNFVIHTIDNKNKYSKFPSDLAELFILVITKLHDIDLLIKIKDIFTGNRVIIILCNDNKEMIHKSYLLHPRFIEFAHNDYQQITEIINKLSGYSTKHSYPNHLYHCERLDHGGGL